ncbi:hypothetical protein EVAR_87669_1 [Eumeta japonica]|uniref:Uncharacterized protein n=1 Tax=Eumeta variegata TaxID=151549 RepID=A0A4C1TQB4_EUMVA|nr:hypothetical protein EVAR_87669_1 [Eumeta japonica]
MTDISDYIADSAHLFKTPTIPSIVMANATFVYKDLATTTHVFSKRDTIRSSFNLHIRDHTKYLKEDKIFTILVNGKRTTVSIERIKPAYTVDDELLNTPHRHQRA